MKNKVAPGSLFNKNKTIIWCKVISNKCPSNLFINKVEVKLEKTLST